MNAIPISWYLIVSAALFCIGLYGLLARRNAVAMLMAVELSLNAVNLNLVAFWRYVNPDSPSGIAWAIFVLTVAAAEAAVGLALIISIYRQRDSVITEELDDQRQLVISPTNITEIPEPRNPYEY